MRTLSLIAGLALAAGVGAATAGDAPDGKALFASKCASCHGKDGKGSASMAKMFKTDIKELDLASKEFLEQKDEDAKAIIGKGKNKMPAFAGKLDDGQIAAILAYSRTLGSAKAQAPAPAAGGDAAKTYAAKCASCHGKDGAGSASMAKMFKVEESALSLTRAETAGKSDEDLAGVIGKGKGKMPAFGGKLSPEEIKDVVGTIRSLVKPKEKADK